MNRRGGDCAECGDSALSGPASMTCWSCWTKAAAAGPVGLVFITKSTFGKPLLLHVQWHGLLDLTNPEQRDRARHYGHPSHR